MFLGLRINISLPMCCQNPISRYEQSPTPSQPTNVPTMFELRISTSIAVTNRLRYAKNFAVPGRPSCSPWRRRGSGRPRRSPRAPAPRAGRRACRRSRGRSPPQPGAQVLAARCGRSRPAPEQGEERGQPDREGADHGGCAEQVGPRPEPGRLPSSRITAAPRPGSATISHSTDSTPSPDRATTGRGTGPPRGTSKSSRTSLSTSAGWRRRPRPTRRRAEDGHDDGQADDHLGGGDDHHEEGRDLPVEVAVDAREGHEREVGRAFSTAPRT